MLAVVLHVLGFTTSALVASITVRDFSLVTDQGEDVFQADFDRRRLQASIVARLALKFNAIGKHFEFEFERSHPLFTPDATITMTGRVCGHKKTPMLLQHVTHAHTHVDNTQAHTRTIRTHTGKRLYKNFTTRNLVIFQPKK